MKALKYGSRDMREAGIAGPGPASRVQDGGGGAPTRSGARHRPSSRYGIGSREPSAGPCRIPALRGSRGRLGGRDAAT
jgi:hypothetical protein